MQGVQVVSGAGSRKRNDPFLLPAPEGGRREKFKKGLSWVSDNGDLVIP